MQINIQRTVPQITELGQLPIGPLPSQKYRLQYTQTGGFEHY